MQDTRLNSIVRAVGQQVQVQLLNPWRRLASLAIALLLGVSLGIGISATAGQWAYLDVIAAGLLVLLAEIVSWLFYSRQAIQQSLGGELLNALKLGLMYGLFLIAFMLGS